MGRSPVDAPNRSAALEASLAALLSRAAGTTEQRAGTSEGPVGTLSAVRRLPAAAPQFVPWPEGVDERLRAALAAGGIEQPYTHQAEAVAHALAGRHVLIVTPTASGKTLCYNVPVFQAVVTDPSARALYVFPTKALAQDQLAELDRLARRLERAGAPSVAAFTYDGDTPQDARAAIRSRAAIVLTNPDMLHTGILPHHPRWASVFEALRYVVLDELHVYRGVFGSHVANVLRRLARICAYYGSRPTFICCSATIANPRELAERLTGQPFAVVEKSGAPQGERTFVFLNPPVVNAALGIRRSYLAVARQVALEFLRRRLQVIVFTQTRLATEILTAYLKDAFDGPPGAAEAVRGYRGGYLPERRREIERGLREGRVLGVVSTNALELGIDIGGLDVAILAGYPGTIAATWQRAGRAGRRAGPSVAVLVASSAPLDQFVARHPEYVLDRSPEHALIDPDNPHIFVDHLKCAAFELPLCDGERFGELAVEPLLELLAEEGLLHHADGRWHWTSDAYPADTVSLRSIGPDNFVVIDTSRGATVVGEVDFASAPATVHEQAIYMVEGQLYQVERFDFEGRKAYCRPVECDYFTDAITSSKVTILDEFEAQAAGECGAFAHGEVRVVSRVVGFKKIRFYTNENVGAGDLELPEHEMHTTACWITVRRGVMNALPFSPEERRGGVVGAATAVRIVAQVLLMCDRHDLGVSLDGFGEVGTASEERGRLGPGATAGAVEEPRIFFYDNHPGGVGFSAPLYRLRRDLLERAHELVAGCPCRSGCPSCVGPPDAVGSRAKLVALELLGRLRESA